MAHPDFKRNAAIGCFMTPLGFFSGAMVGVLLSVTVAHFIPSRSCAQMEIPSCDWYVYAGYGGVFGALTLPFLVLRALFRRPDRPGPGDEPARPIDARTTL